MKAIRNARQCLAVSEKVDELIAALQHSKQDVYILEQCLEEARIMLAAWEDTKGKQ